MSQKVAYVTGGMGGIGTAICQRLHKEGFKVIAGCGPTRDYDKWLAEQKALARAGWKAQDVDLFELNEAFAAQACAVNKALDIDPLKVNVNGGAIAIGHPIGASGCRILVTLLHEMLRRQANKGLAALCIGGGMGVSLALERV